MSPPSEQACPIRRQGGAGEPIGGRRPPGANRQVRSAALSARARQLTPSASRRRFVMDLNAGLEVAARPKGTRALIGYVIGLAVGIAVALPILVAIFGLQL